ncbi:unnamed protein product [Diatraea saccharalis]|uniref:Sulfotransferase domain-containing protein n=1 Tax=Diatraea saccharalis TaxID=40085 RepID=A0A9N9QV30_9NEOP|nr:unnamed protein product [Diatraea saccharalis]
MKDLDQEESDEVFKYFSESFQDGFVRIGPKGYFYTSEMKDMAPIIYNMVARPDDTWVVSFPKSGTTWIQELVWLVANDFDYATAEAVPLVARFPFIEGSMFKRSKKARTLFNFKGTEEQTEALFNSADHAAKLKSPRFIKSHLPLSMLPPALLDTCKVVHIARDPRDIMDFPSTVQRVAKFLGKTVTEEQMSRLCEHLAFNNFKRNKSVNMEFFKELNTTNTNASPFIRKGKAGGWRENFDEEMTRQAEQWMADNLRDTDLRYPTV